MLLALCVWLAGLAPPAGAAPLTVSATVSLTEPLEELLEVHRAAGGGPVAINFAGSNVLARQILAGAPVDVFISADYAQMEVVEQAGLVEPGTRVPLVGNQLVVIVESRSTVALNSIHDLARSDIRRIAIGDPAAVPAGVYARQYLERAGIWAALEERLVPSTNVRAALTAVRNGGADAGIVYATDVRSARGVRIALTIAGPEAPRIAYPAAVLKRSRQRAAAEQLLRFLASDAARRVFERHGFTAPPHDP